MKFESPLIVITVTLVGVTKNEEIVLKVKNAPTPPTTKLRIMKINPIFNVLIRLHLSLYLISLFKIVGVLPKVSSSAVLLEKLYIVIEDKHLVDFEEK